MLRKKSLLSMEEDEEEEVEESTHFCYIKHRLKLVKHHTAGLKIYFLFHQSFFPHKS